MEAVIKTGGKQVRVKVGDVVRVERLEGEIGGGVEFDRVLLVSGDDPRVGRPTVEGAVVRGSIVEQDRGPKIVTYKFKRRQNSNRKTIGHRQSYTAVKIESING